jgi:hypothetical protein
VTFQVFLAERAQTDLDGLPQKIAGQILADCSRLADDPIPDGNASRNFEDTGRISTDFDQEIIASYSNGDSD